ncbi:MAG: hypothetical protein EZS28_030636 [Streblomastix strix]|uniref:Uncharacterized protein n=1 Tax=Streblomastix strix TaxID=222440 RepID=A0A5J4UTY6_9EUKA|nr:MAG: hypothetical protein EZS28_030636 [Streblomastix strix]
MKHATGDFAFSAESGTVWMYESAWYDSGQLVPDQVTPVSDELPLVDGTASAGISTSYSRGDHVHPQQLTYDGNVTATKFIKNGAQATDVLLDNGDSKPISDITGDGFVAKTGKTLQSVQGVLRHSGDDEESEDDDDYITRGYLYNQYVSKASPDTITACDPNSSTGTLPDQWNIAVFDTGEIKLALGAQVNQANRGLMISADGNTLSFNGSVIAGTGASTGASNGSVNYSAGNPILWGVNSVGTEGGFYSDGPKIYWRAKPVTLGAVPP